MHEIVLDGCRPEPLSSYLQALGLLRVLCERAEPEACGYWRGDRFVLSTQCDRTDVLRFFLESYRPSPILAPWNGGSGFHPKDNKVAIGALKSSKSLRFAFIRAAITTAEAALGRLGITDKPDKEQKALLLVELRNWWEDDAQQWLDTAAMLTTEGVEYPPLTGTGGNDGRLDFTRNYLERLLDLIDPETGAPSATAPAMLEAALFGEVRPCLSRGTPIGQFNPLATGGANALSGFQADSVVNPWEYVLMLEGTLLFTAAATRRLEQVALGETTYPFSVRASGTGYGSAAEDDGRSARAELWAPLWESPTTAAELRVLFAEGRAKIGRKTARTGVDFARALAGLGVHRGLTAFVRYGFHVRNGLAYFATPLGRFIPRRNPKIDLLGRLDGWLADLERATRDSHAPASLRRAHRMLEQSIMDVAADKSGIEEILIALGSIDAAIDRSSRFAKEKRLRPVPPLENEWLAAIDITTPELRLALALAARHLMMASRAARPLRQRLVHVDHRGYATEGSTDVTWQAGALENNLLRFLQREEVDLQRARKAAADTQEQDASSPADEQPACRDLLPYATAEDVKVFIDRHTDDARLETLARGFALIRRPLQRVADRSADLPLAYRLLVLAHQDSLSWTPSSEAIRIPRTPGVLTKAAAGDMPTATRLASQRLYGEGLIPVERTVYEPKLRAKRIAAALAFPLSSQQVARFMERTLRLPDSPEERGDEEWI
ncbi:MAG: type I-U CRISPR-associated protein Csx17 [Planctomycetota bacterium]